MEEEIRIICCNDSCKELIIKHHNFDDDYSSIIKCPKCGTEQTLTEEKK